MKLLLYFWGSPDGAQQLGAVAHGGGSVIQRGGELGCLAEVVLQVLGRFVINTWRTQGETEVLKSKTLKKKKKNLLCDLCKTHHDKIQLLLFV